MDAQQELNFDSATRFKIRRAAQFPKGFGVKPGTLKNVLKAIDDYGFRNGSFASVATLVRESNVPERTLRNAMKVLEQLGVIYRHRRGAGDARTSISITWNVLATFGYQTADLENQPANSAKLPADSTKLPAESAPSYPAETVKKPLRNRTEAPSDVDADGARFFSDEERELIRDKANTINDKFKAQRGNAEDRELVLKVATLWNDGQFSEDMLGQVLESYERKPADKPILDPRAWFWGTMRGQCEKHGLRFEQLLARTEFPQELLATPPRAGIIT